MEIKILGAFMVGVGIAVFIGGYLVARTIRQYDNHIDDLYVKFNGIKEKLDTLVGEHDVLHKAVK